MKYLIYGKTRNTYYEGGIYSLSAISGKEIAADHL